MFPSWKASLLFGSSVALLSGACIVFWGEIDKVISLTSLVISSVALSFVAASLSAQVRQVKISQDENMRRQHSELLVMSINDPVLRKCWGSASSIANRLEDEQRQMLFSNMIFTWYYSSYVIEDVNDAQLRINLTRFFEGEVGRSYWVFARVSWLQLVSAAGAEKRKRFVAIADSCYNAVLARNGGA
ncbi:DUF6082 family protein [Streptomyces mirabilis]